MKYLIDYFDNSLVSHIADVAKNWKLLSDTGIRYIRLIGIMKLRANSLPKKQKVNFYKLFFVLLKRLPKNYKCTKNDCHFCERMYSLKFSPNNDEYLKLSQKNLHTTFSKLKKNILILNVGGIANITYIPADGDKEKVIAFDTGPGNMLIDQLMQRMYELPFDKNGEKAFLGNFSQKLFDYLIKIDSYPQKKPPKSTGREHYGKEFVISLLRRAVRRRIPEPDVIHTATKYTAFTVWQASEKFINQKIDTVFVGGGGSHNKFLMDSLSDYFKNSEIKKTGDLGIDEDYKEAICFAILANELVRGNPVNLPAVTGATKPAFLGKICPT